MVTLVQGVRSLRSGEDQVAAPSDARYWLILLFFWFAHGVAWLVFWLVWEVLGENPGIINEALRGTGHSLGFGLLFDRVFHVLPAPLLSFYIYAR